MTRALVHDDSGAMDSATENFVRYRRHGDLAALGLVFDALAPRLLALALHLCGNAADAEDALQATFVVAMQKAATFDASQAVGPWLAGVLAGEARNLTRRERRRRGDGAAETRAVAAGVDPATAAEQSDLVARLRTHIEALPIEQRQVLLLQLQYGLQPAEIAEVVGVPPGTVRMRLHRGMQTLRAVLPAGLVGSVLALLPSRGLAQVRAAVLREATAVTTGLGVVAAVGIGGLLMKKLMLGVAAGLLLLLGGWWMSKPDDGNAIGVAVVQEGASRVVASDAAPPTATGANGDAAASERTAAMPSHAPVGSARIVVRGDEMQRDGRDVWVATSSHGSGELVPHAPIELRSKDAAGGSRRVLTTDAGEVVVADLPVGQWVARTMFLLDVPVQLDFRVTEGAEVAVELHIGMKAAHGRVVDARGAPVAGAEVWVGRDGMLGVLTGVHLSQLVPARFATTSGADGTFRCLHLGNEWFVGARKAGYANSWAHPNLQGATTLALADRPASIVVHVLFEGDVPRDGLVVVAEGERAMRRIANGDRVRSPLATIGREVGPCHFVLEGLAAGPHAVSLLGHGHRADAKVSLLPGQQSEVTLRVRDFLAVRGRVVGEDGSPKAGVPVTTRADAGSGTRTVHTQDDGTFEFLAQARVPFTLAASRTSSLAKVEQRVVPPARGDVQCDLVLVEKPPLRGQLRSAAGGGVPRWWIRAQGENDATAQFRQCDEAGAFAFWGLQGTFAALSAHRSVQAPAIAGTEVRVAVGSDPVVLTVPAEAMPTASVQGRVVDAEGKAILSPTVGLDGGHEAPPSLGDNSFTLGELDAGKHVLRIAGTGCLPLVRAIELTAGQQLDLGDVVLARSAILRVRFLRPDGSPWTERPPLPAVIPVRPRPSSGGELQVDYEVTDDGVVVVTGMLPGRYRVHGSEHDELLLDPVEVDLRTEAATEVTLRTAVGRRRELRFAPSTAATDPQPTVAQVRRDDGVVILQREWNAVAGAVEPLDCVLPIGEYVAEGRAGSVVTHRARFRVGPELADAAVVDVGLLR